MIKLDNKKNETVAAEKDDEKVQEVQESEFNIYGFSEAIIKEYGKPWPYSRIRTDAPFR